jgi:hypothetical protein
MFIKKLFIFLSLLLMISACQDVMDPNIDKMPVSLVVEGKISTRQGGNKISISTTKSFNESFYISWVTGLEVYVIDNNGLRIDFLETTENGEYVTDSNPSSLAKTGNSYTLYIKSKDGTTYQSTPQIVTECSETDLVHLENSVETILTENTYGDILELKNNGSLIYANTSGILPEKNYYLFRSFGYIENRAIVSVPNTSDITIYQHMQIPFKYLSFISTGNADEFSDKSIRKNKLVFVPEDVYLNFEPVIPPKGKILYRYFDGFIIATEQLSLNEEAYNFWEQLKRQLNASNKIFDPMPTQISGNLRCTSDPEKKIYGIFFATDSKIRYDYLYINKKHKAFSKEIDSIPELYLDGIRDEHLPAGWIMPPY